MQQNSGFMFDKLKNKVLNNSDSYNYYKNQNKVLLEKIDGLEKRIGESEKRLEAYHQFLENIYLDHDLKPNSLWAKIQDLDCELLTFIKHVCIKNNIDYWLDYGTLLGAVRHKGFIPWDDDIDIAMMRRDFEKIFPLLEDEIKKNYLDDVIDLRVYHSNVNGIVLGFIQFSYRHSTGIILSNVDIFPYDFAPKDFDYDLYYRERSNFFIKLEKGENPKKTVSEYMDKLNVSYDESNFIVPGPEGPRGLNGYGCKVYNKSSIFPLTQIKFKDKLFSCPKNSDEYLKGIYGEYLKIPQEIAHHNLLNSLKRIEGIEEILDDAFKTVNQVNLNNKK